MSDSRKRTKTLDDVDKFRSGASKRVLEQKERFVQQGRLLVNK